MHQPIRGDGVALRPFSCGIRPEEREAMDSPTLDDLLRDERVRRMLSN